MSIERMGLVAVALSGLVTVLAVVVVWLFAEIDRAMTEPNQPAKRRRWLR